MSDEKIITWSLRLITIMVILVPLAFYYFTSESTWSFLIPALTLPSNLMSFNLRSLRITSLHHHHISGNTFLLTIGLSNVGNVRIGLKELDVRISASSLSGRLVLQSTFVLEPGESGRVNITLFLESGTGEDLMRLLSQNLPANLSGKVTLILDSAELPLDLSVTNLSIRLLVPALGSHGDEF